MHPSIQPSSSDGLTQSIKKYTPRHKTPTTSGVVFVVSSSSLPNYLLWGLRHHSLLPSEWMTQNGWHRCTRRGCDANVTQNQSILGKRYYSKFQIWLRFFFFWCPPTTPQKNLRDQPLSPWLWIIIQLIILHFTFFPRVNDSYQPLIKFFSIFSLSLLFSFSLTERKKKKKAISSSSLSSSVSSNLVLFSTLRALMLEDLIRLKVPSEYEWMRRILFSGLDGCMYAMVWVGWFLPPSSSSAYITQYTNIHIYVKLGEREREIH